MFNPIDLYSATNEAHNEMVGKYIVVRNGNFFFKKYSVCLKGDTKRLPVYTGNLDECKEISKKLIAAGLLGVYSVKEYVLCEVAMAGVKK